AMVVASSNTTLAGASPATIRHTKHGTATTYVTSRHPDRADRQRDPKDQRLVTPRRSGACHDAWRDFEHRWVRQPTNNARRGRRILLSNYKSGVRRSLSASTLSSRSDESTAGS